jgi:hypothetical protein
MQELIEKEGSMQGRIEKLLMIVEQMELSRYEDYAETDDSLGEMYEPRYGKGHFLPEERPRRLYHNQSTQFSRLCDSRQQLHP